MRAMQMLDQLDRCDRWSQQITETHSGDQGEAQSGQRDWAGELKLDSGQIPTAQPQHNGGNKSDSKFFPVVREDPEETTTFGQDWLSHQVGAEALS